MKRTMKGIVSLILLMTAVCLFGLSAGAYAAAGAADGQVEYVGGTNSTPSGSVYEINVSKTIEAVSDKENYFDITLRTTTHRHHVDMSTDVIVVLDISNTMNFDAVQGSGSKLEQAKAATNQFIKQFAEDAKLSPNRRVGVVTFNQNAQVAVSLQECNDTNDYLNNFEQKVKNISAPKTPDEIKFTNIEGGLQLAKNILDASTSRYKFVILLTDGFPTTYIQSDRNSTSKINGYDTYMSHEVNKNKGYNVYDEDKIGKDSSGNLKNPGYMVNVGLEKSCTAGVDYSDYGAQRAQAVAQQMKNGGINIFSVGVGIGGMTIQGYLEAHKGKTFSTVDTNGMGSGGYVIGSDTDTNSYKTWLGDSIAGGPQLSGSSAVRYAPGDSTTQLATAYTNILTNIRMAPATTNREFYTIDPMSDVADFIGFFDKDGNLAANPNKLTGQSKQNAENTAEYEESNNQTITWDQLNSGFTMDGQELVYTLKYRVRLKNESSGFEWSTAYDANDTTTLNYKQTYSESGQDVPGGTGTLDYPIPEVEGYKGSLKFKKVDGSSGNQALAGVEFTLRHDGAGCDVCKGDASIADMQKTSGSDGVVSFDNIPSGHEYTLIEREPAGYAPVHNHTVIVSYGDTYIGSKTTANKLTDGKYADGRDFTVINTKDEPVEIQFTAAKTLNGQTPAANAFSFRIEGKKAHAANFREVVKNDGSGKVTFSKIIFDTPGTYEYTISEVAGSDSGIVYDKTTHTVKVVVAEHQTGTAYQATVTVDNGQPQTFTGIDNVVDTVAVGTFANTARGHAQIHLEANKSFTGGNLAEGQWQFKLEAVDQAPLPADVQVSNGANGSVSFGPIVFDAPGVYRYRISEVAGSNKQIAYDPAVYTAVVTVSAPSDLTSGAALSASVVYQDESGENVSLPSFNNRMKTLPTVTMKGYKSMNGVDAAADAFTFAIVEVGMNGRPVSGGVSTEIRNGANGVIDFDAVLAGVVQQLVAEANSSESGVATARNFLIYEKPGSASGVVYDEVRYVLQLGVINEPLQYELTAQMQEFRRTDTGYDVESIFRVGRGTNIVISGVNSAPLVKFENTSSLTLNLEATKRLDDKNKINKLLKEGDYTFILEGPTGVLQSKTNAADGSVTFDPIEFTAEDVGTHSYVIYEVEGDNPSMFYDDSLYTVTVTVSMDEHGVLSMSEPTIKDETITDEYDDESFAAIEFVNKDLTPTHLHLTAKKRINEEQIPTVAQRFSFELVNADTNEVIETIHNVHETVAFTHLELEKEGTYHYIVREVIPEGGEKLGGFTYDTTEYNVKVVVKGDANGALQKTVKVNGEDVSSEHNTVAVGTFNNTYKAQPAGVTLNGTKTLEGRDLTADAFSFRIEAVTEGAPMPANVTVTNDALGSFAFGEITFSAAGTYKYIVREVIPEDAVNGVKDGVTYDDTVYTVVVTVTDNGQGNLIAQKTVNGSANTAIDFANKYSTTGTSMRITADKVLTGRDLKRGEFSFRLVEVDGDGNAVSGTEQIVTNGAAYGSALGDVVFGSLIYHETGTHVYQISEVIPADKLGGVTYDTHIATVTVVVEDNGLGQLEAKVNGQTVDTADAGTFENSYAAGGTQVVLKAKKILENMDLKADQFAFTLTDMTDPNNPKPMQTKKNAADGSVVFDVIPYSDGQEGVYTYEIAEVNGGQEIDYIVYDGTKRTVQVEVIDHHNGTMSVKVNGAAVTGDANVGTFTNSYVEQYVTVPLTATKILDGRELRDSEFWFELKDKDGKVLQTQTYAAGGVVTFDALTYPEREAGRYTYTISEQTGINPGIHYDKTEYTVTVDVKMNDQDVLIAEVLIDGEADKPIVFTNKWDPKGAVVELQVNKQYFDGLGSKRALAGGEFQFQLLDETGKNVLYTATNAANGAVVFQDVIVGETGEHTYLLREVRVSTESVALWDETVYTVVVKVEETKPGIFEATSIRYLRGGEEVPSVTFVNIGNTTGEADLPETGDTSSLLLWALLAIAASGAALMLRRKRD